MGIMHNADGFFKRVNSQQVGYIDMPVSDSLSQCYQTHIEQSLSVNLYYSLNRFIRTTDLFRNKTNSL